jgi:hypothetical protein
MVIQRLETEAGEARDALRAEVEAARQQEAARLEGAIKDAQRAGGWVRGFQGVGGWVWSGGWVEWVDG